MRISVCTLDRLRKAISLRPKILHMSCHGGYEMEGDEAKLYLYLERGKLDGMVEKYDVETFKKWFQAEISDLKEVRPRLVFVSACYSQEVGEAIKEAGIPNVIAVNCETQVADEAAIRFSKVLYHYLTLGKSVKEAFEQTKEDGKVSLRNLRMCCCTHNHKEGCELLQGLINNPEEAHAKHIPDCSCPFGGNTHYKNCGWVEAMKDLPYVTKQLGGKPARVKICCCNPDLPHNEEEKFVLISQSPEAQDERLFEDLLDSEPRAIKDFNPQMLPTVDEQLIGRNINLHHLLKFLISTAYEERIISLNGPKGVGKNSLVRAAAKYAIERGFFPDGIATTVSLSSLSWLLSNLNTALLPPHSKEARNLLELGQKIKSVKKLVVMQCHELIERNPHQFMKDLRKVLKEGTQTKFVVLSKKPINEKHVVNVTLGEDLEPVSAYMIIKQKNPEWKCTYNIFESTSLGSILTTPWLAKKAAYMLKYDSAEEVYAKLLKNDLVPQAGKDMASIYDEYVKSEQDLFDALKDKCAEMKPIYVLAQLPFGLFESDLQEICEEDFDKWKEKAQDFITESNEAQTVVLYSKVEDLKETKYKLADVALRYVNEHSLSKREKTQYQILCLEALATLARKLVRSYNINVYKQLKHNEFTAIVDDGVWARRSDERISRNKGLPLEPIIRFQAMKDNFMIYLDPKLLEEIVEELDNVGVEVHKVMKVIKELAICTFTMLLRLERPQEALQVADSIQGFAETQKTIPRQTYQKKIRNYCREVIGMMQLMKGGITFTEEEVVGTKDAFRQAEGSVKSFNIAENEVGVGEALFLQGLISARDPERKNYAPDVFREAKLKFNKETYAIGIARISIAEAKLLLTSAEEDDSISYIEGILKEAKEILEEKPFYDNMLAECYYFKAMCAEKRKDYDQIKEYLLFALEKAKSVGNREMEKSCESMLNHSSACMQKDYPLFVFLKSFPIVKRLPDEPPKVLEPFTRNQSTFRQEIIGDFENMHAAVKMHFDTLTRENLKQALLRSCLVLQLSSEYPTPDALNLEGPLGELDELPLPELKAMLIDYIRLSQCKVVIVMIQNGEKIAQAFAQLGIPHVFCFQFSSNNLLKYKDMVPLSSVQRKASHRFGTELHKFLVLGETVDDACEKATKLMVEAIQTQMEQFGIKGFTLDLEKRPIIFPLDPTLHKVKVLSNFRVGKYIETSPKRGVCNIEKERRPLVGRQLELFKIISDLKANKCVNLYGRRGVGKTKLSKELAYFLYVRPYFPSGIYYRGDTQPIYDPKYFVPLGDAKNGGYSVLYIVDNLDASTWKMAEKSFQALRKDREYVFLFISQEPLEHSPKFEITKHRLKPLRENESMEYVMSCLEQSKYTVDKPLTKAFPSRSELQREILESTGFRQAHGYPTLLCAFCEKIFEGARISEINLLDEPKIDPYFKRVIMHHEANETRLSLLPTLQHMNSYQMPSKQRKTADRTFYPSSRLSADLMQKRKSVYLNAPQESNEIQLSNMRTQYFKQSSRPMEEIYLMQPTEETQKQESGWKEVENERNRRLFGAFNKTLSERPSLNMEYEDTNSEIFGTPEWGHTMPKIVEPEKEIPTEISLTKQEDTSSEKESEEEGDGTNNISRISKVSGLSKKAKRDTKVGVLKKSKAKHKKKAGKKVTNKGKSCIIFKFPGKSNDTGTNM
eukprot:TRINITY_DN120601_c1_g1_i1.p1 TRINITY_DN120601_c1_g1~~TRINITY_DN120601_c1_g1_i1.p1  ORF type:complete len:1935 (+),score=215.27 TRINITY_DN120601_c1_g1_i1:789-5807(+)